MAGIKAPIQDIMARLTTEAGISFVRVWNNQLQWMEQQQIEAFPFPAAFVEVQMPNSYDQAAMGITVSDVVFRVHLCTVEYDAQDGTMEQNLSIFTLRDTVIKALTYYKPTGCGNLQKVNEEQDYQHTNVYHYIVDFKCAFVDDKGDTRQGQITTGPPTDVEIDPTIETVITPVIWPAP